MNDPRKEYIFNFSKNFMNFPKENLIESINHSVEVSRFLDVEQCLSLFLINNEGKMYFCNDGNKAIESDKGLIAFYKNKPSYITDDNIANAVYISYIPTKPAIALFHTLSQLFSPLLFQNSKGNNNINPTIQEQISNLQNTLRSSIASIAEKSEQYEDTVTNLAIVLKLDHELDFWDNIAKTAKRSKERESGVIFRDILKPLINDFNNLESLDFLDAEDVLENSHNAFDDLWRHERHTFPQPRMQNLLVIVANMIVQFIEKQLFGINVWTHSFNEISVLLENCVALNKRWIDSCTKLTKLFWPNHVLHPWVGDVFVPPIAENFGNRLQEILDIRTIYRQLIRLLSRVEQQELESKDIFKLFEDMYVLQCNPYTEPKWKAAVAKFENSLKPAEERVAAKLKIQLGTSHANTRQLLHEFSRYGELIARSTVKQALISEREQLLSMLIDYVQQLSNSKQNTNQNSNVLSDLTPVVQDIVLLRQLEARGNEVQKISEKLLSDLGSYSILENSVTTFLSNLKQQNSDLFDSWVRQTNKNIENQTLTLKENEPVVEFSKSKMMRVNYSPRLLVLIREVRQLSALNYRIPTHVYETAQHAKKFMNYAKTLEQVASFHNTIGDRMIASQRPMMLAGAMNLAKLVQEEAAVSWSDVEKVEHYINSLRLAVDRLSRENNQLAAAHSQLGEKVSELHETDLIRYQHKWKDGLNFMKEIISQIASQGFTNMQAWKQYWNSQLANSLEHQYQLGLEEIHQHLPEIKADLIYRSGRVMFNPPIEELRMKCYSQLKRYLAIPIHFRGVSDENPRNVFSDIVERSREKFIPVYEKTEQLMDDLLALTTKWAPWVSLGYTDLDELVEKNLNVWKDWDINFRESKSFGQQIAKLISWEEKIGYFTISLGLIRSDMEAQNRKYWTTLVTSLQASIVRDVATLSHFIETAVLNLTKQPRTPDEVADIHQKHTDILNQISQQTDLYVDLMARNKTLANWSKDRIESATQLQGPWEHLQSLISNHQHLIEKQMEGIKSSLAGAVNNHQEEINRWFIRWEEMKPKPQSQSIPELIKSLKIIKENRASWNLLKEQKEKIISDFTRFGMDLPSFKQFDEIEATLTKEDYEWSIVEKFSTELQEFNDEDWIVFRKQIYKLDDFLSVWQDNLANNKSILSINLLQEIQKYKNAIPTLKLLRGEDFTEKYWIEVFNLLSIPPRSLDSLTLGNLTVTIETLANPDLVATLQVLNKKAASEVIVRQALSELDTWEMQCRFTLSAHTDSTGRTVMLIKDFKEILNLLGDNQCLLQSVKTAADYESFSERGNLWESRLADLDQYINQLNQIQRKWVYLEPIFGRGTLRQEQSRFKRIDREFRIILDTINKDTRVAALSRINDLKAMLDMLLDQLGRCQTSLNQFLVEKRSIFPRFLFLGDDDLLEILGQSAHEKVIQSHLKKLFSGINSVEIKTDSSSIVETEKTNQKITAIKSAWGEMVPLKNHISIMKPVEEWLNDLVKEMKSTLQELLKECLADTRNERKNDIGADPMNYPSQIICLAANINFTRRTERAIINDQLSSLLSHLKVQSNHYTNLEVDFDTGYSVLELKLRALLIDLTHHIAVVEELIENNVNTLQNWHWFKQLRYYENANGLAILRMANAEFDYSYEYLGNAPKLVHTPLTDKCFLTLTQGMHIGLGGNPYGPAGTGKTESVKALGGILGRQVLVFNCDEGIDSKSMSRILVGLARCGAWGCFDEFNRLDEGTLSSVSTQIQNIQTAIVSKTTSIHVHNEEVIVNPHCGIFVTLNPAGKGYGARNRLPDNLKQLFRPVVMSTPNEVHIAQVLLFIEGFRHAKILATRLCELFNLAKQLLSKQQHYDWGLRALKTVLSTCGSILRQARSTKHEIKADDSLNHEMELIIGAVRLNVLSKLTFYDRCKFDNLIKDIFPAVSFSGGLHDQLRIQIENSFEELGLEINEQQVNKCVELFEQLSQRMGVVIVGPPSSGKSTIRRILLHALLKIKKILKERIVNPKSISRTQLLGKVDPETRQWSDGVLTLYALDACNETPDVHTWIVCDGDIDPEWIEALNSVLDDNRLLTLPSGWRIQFQDNVNFIFETHDLTHASPATISRMGIIYLSDENFDLKYIVKTWLKNQPENIQLLLESLIDTYFYKAIDWTFQEGQFSVESSQIGVILTALSQFNNVKTKAQFAVALIAGLGGLLKLPSRQILAKHVFEWTEEFCNESNDIVYLYFDEKRNLTENFIPIESFEANANDMNISLIYTQSVQHALYTLNKFWEQNKEHFLLVGPHGSAKNLIIKHLYKKHRDIEVVSMHCSPNLNTDYVLFKLSQYCLMVSSSKGRVFRPKKGHLVLHFIGLHYLKTDQWGTNLLISFLQQMISYRGIFDKNLEWIGLENITIVGTLEPSTSLSTRFTSILRIHTIDLPNQEELQFIFRLYLKHILKTCIPKSGINVENITEKLLDAMLSLYKDLKINFTPVQSIHYNFSPHDITVWCQHLLRYKENVIENEDWLLEAFYHEARRIFYDKLISNQDKTKFDELCSLHITRCWPGTNSFLALAKVNDSYFTTENNNFIPPWGLQLRKLNKMDWTACVNRSKSFYENENGQIITLPVFKEMLELIAKIERVSTTPGKSILLAGRSGVGRKTAAKISASVQGARLVVASENIHQFKIDIKSVIQSAAIERETIFLLVEDYILKNAYIQEIVDMLLTAGEVLGLYSNTEFESICSSLRDQLEQEAFEGSLVEYFNSRVKERLHIIVILDVENDEHISFFKENPNILLQCSIVWIENWSLETMKQIPELLISSNLSSTNEKASITLSDGFEQIHMNIPNQLQTPDRYVTFINTYCKIYLQKHQSIVKQQKKLQAGILKLTEAREIVANLKLAAQEKERELADRQAKANQALEMIANTMKNAHSHKGELQGLKERTENENKLILQRKVVIEKELAEVEPLIQEARAAVGNIRPEALSEIRSLRAPPDVIRDILEGVLRLMGILDTSWNSMKMFLSKRGVKDEIRSFDATIINPEHRLAVEKLLVTRKESFEAKNARRASIAAAPLAAWVNANVQYARVLEKIRPLEKEQQKLKKNLFDAEKQIAELSSGLSDVNETVDKLKAQLSIYSREAAETEISLKSAKGTLENAEGLVSKLQEEYNRWQEQFSNLSEELNILPKKSLLSAAFITYLSNEPENKRTQYLQAWLEFVKLDDNEFSLEFFLYSEKDQLQWIAEKLPSDRLSIQNGVIILECWLIPLLLDSNSITLEWLKNHYANRSIEITNQNNPKFNSVLELAIRFGKVLIVEDVDTISPIFYPILRGSYIQQGERRLVSFSGRLIDYHPDFKLFFMSRNTSLQLPSTVSSKITLVNFTTTLSALTDQLIASAVQQERSDLEVKRRDLLKKQESLQLQLVGLQDNLLEELGNAQGNILENKDLLMSLNKTKKSSAEVTTALSESTKIQKELSAECNIYKPLAEFASQLYFGVCEMSRINILYQLSVTSFTKLFLKILPRLQFENSEISDERRNLLQLVFLHVSRGIFKSDCLLFAMHLVHKIIPNEIPDDEWELFTRQDTAIGKLDTSHAADKVPSWLPENRIHETFLLQVAQPNLYSILNFEDQNLWKNFMQSIECENNFPTSLSPKPSLFQQILVVQALRPDRLYSTVSKCVTKLIGLRNLNQGMVNLSQILSETKSTEPILLISSSGIDPSYEIRELGFKIVGEKNFSEISMSQGEYKLAIEGLIKASTNGQWLCLKNLHLVIDWLPILSQQLKQLSYHKDFRLWLTTEPHKNFSTVLAQSCLRIAYEAPQSIKQNLLRTFEYWKNNSKDTQQNKKPVERRVLFALACIHAIIQERRTFIPQGWSKPYEFSDNDLMAARELIVNILSLNNSQIEWPVIRGLCATAVYGGRIDNHHDEQILHSYMEQYFEDSILSHLWKPFDLPIVNTDNIKAYIETAMKLSDSDLPSYFGLPSNIHRMWEINAGGALISQLKVLGLFIPSSNNFNLSFWQKKLTPLLNFWKKINQNQEWFKTKILQQSQETNNMIADFVETEYKFGISVVQTIHKSLVALSKIMRGSELPNDTTFETGKCLIKNQVPELWKKTWDGPEEPFIYLRTIIQCIKYLIHWRDQGEQLNIYKTPVNLSLIFHPDAFLATLKQQTSRETKLTTDELHLTCSWGSSANVPSGIIIENLQVEGAIFTYQGLSPCKSDSANVSTAPHCALAWASTKQGIAGNTLAIPLYYSSKRQKELATLYIPINDSINIWLQAGTAIYLNRGNYINLP